MLVESNLDVFGEKEWAEKSEEDKAKVLTPKSRELLRDSQKKNMQAPKFETVLEEENEEAEVNTVEEGSADD